MVGKIFTKELEKHIVMVCEKCNLAYDWNYAGFKGLRIHLRVKHKILFTPLKKSKTWREKQELSKLPREFSVAMSRA